MRRSVLVVVATTVAVAAGALWVVRDRARLVRARTVSAALRADRPRARRELRSRPGSPGGGDLHGEQIRRQCQVSSGGDRVDAAAPGDGEGDRRSHRRQGVRRRRSLRPGDQRALRVVVPTAPARPLRRRGHGAGGVPRRARATSTSGGARARGSSFPRPGPTSTTSAARGGSTRTRTRRSSRADSVLEQAQDEIPRRHLVTAGAEQDQPVEHDVEKEGDLLRLEVVAQDAVALQLLAACPVGGDCVLRDRLDAATEVLVVRTRRKNSRYTLYHSGSIASTSSTAPPRPSARNACESCWLSRWNSSRKMSSLEGK